MKTFFDRIHNKFVSTWVVLLMDVFIVVFAFIFSTLIRFNFQLDYVDPLLFKYHLLLVVGVKLFFFYLFGSYKGIVRHTSMLDTRNILGTSLLVALTLFLIGYLGKKLYVPLYVPKSILMIDLFVSVFGLLGSRILIKDIFKTLSMTWKPPKKVVIYGAGNLGMITKNVLSGNLDTSYKVLFFIDDNPQKRGKNILGVRVYNRLEAREVLFNIKAEDIELVFAIQDITTERKNSIVDEFISLGMQVRVVPPVEEWMNGQLNASQIAEISIEDLLERPTINIDNRKLREFLQGKRILITGAAGSIGSEIARQILKYSPRALTLIDQGESALYDLETELTRVGSGLEFGTELRFEVENIISEVQMAKLFERYKPMVVFHAAAYKHVPLMEANPTKAVEVNVVGTRILADLSVKYNVSNFVFISTDKAVNPTNVMGASKRLAELYIQGLNNAKGCKTRFTTTRFGNVLGSNGSVIPLFKKQIAEGGPLTVTHPEIIRYFMTIPEACQLVLEAGTMGKGGEIFVFDMGVPVRIVDLAYKMIRLSGKEGRIPVIFTGLRPGEKLYEELLNEEESTLPTHHAKIMIAKTAPSVFEQINKGIDSIQASLVSLSHEEVVRFLKTLIPEYISNNSPFEKLDRNEKI